MLVLTMIESLNDERGPWMTRGISIKCYHDSRTPAVSFAGGRYGDLIDFRLQPRNNQQAAEQIVRRLLKGQSGL